MKRVRFLLLSTSFFVFCMDLPEIKVCLPVPPLKLLAMRCLYSTETDANSFGQNLPAELIELSNDFRTYHFEFYAILLASQLSCLDNYSVPDSVTSLVAKSDEYKAYAHIMLKKLRQKEKEYDTFSFTDWRALHFSRLLFFGGKSTLGYLIDKGRLDYVEKLVAIDPAFDSPDIFGKTALHYLVTRNYDETLKKKVQLLTQFMMLKKADPHQVDNIEVSPIAYLEWYILCGIKQPDEEEFYKDLLNIVNTLAN